MNQMMIGRAFSARRTLVVWVVLLAALATACSRQEVPRSWVVGKWEGKAGATIIFDENGNVRVHKMPFDFDGSHHVVNAISGSGTWQFYGFNDEDDEPYPIHVTIEKKDGGWGRSFDVAAYGEVIYIPYDIDLMDGFEFKRVGEKK